jgi:hypothetical protein
MRGHHWWEIIQNKKNERNDKKRKRGEREKKHGGYAIYKGGALHLAVNERNNAASRLPRQRVMNGSRGMPSALLR